jgi:hypothetical protein
MTSNARLFQGRLTAVKKIAQLTPLLVDEGAALDRDARFVLDLARGVVRATHGICQVELITYGATPGRRTIGEGLTVRTLQTAAQPEVALDVLSWGLPEAIAGADLVHIYHLFTRSGEMALLAAKVQGKPACVSNLGPVSSTLGLDLGIIDLADCVICFSDRGVSLPSTRAPVEVIAGGAALDTAGAKLLAVYEHIFAGARGMAA